MVTEADTVALWSVQSEEQRPIPAPARWWTTAAMALVLAACAPKGGYYKDDGPPQHHPVDPHSVPDAVPRAEARSETGNDPYEVYGKRYVPMRSADGYRRQGTASWYGKKFHGKRTSSGEPYDMFAMTAAHRTLPLPSYARVTNLKNDRSVVVRINDRGPFLDNRLIDLSYVAAYKLGIVDKGTGYVEVSSVPARTARPASDPGSLDSASLKKVSGGDGGRFFVQFGAFARSQNAQSLIRELQENGIGFAHIQQGSDGYYKVRSGPFSSAASAERLMLRGEGMGLNSTIVAE